MTKKDELLQLWLDFYEEILEKKYWLQDTQEHLDFLVHHTRKELELDE